MERVLLTKLQDKQCPTPYTHPRSYDIMVKAWKISKILSLKPSSDTYTIYFYAHAPKFLSIC